MPNILVTGGYGFVGQAIFRQSLPEDYHLFRFPSTKYNLLNVERTYDLLQTNEYDAIIHCAGHTGGKKGHAGNHARFLVDNTIINSNVLEAASLLNIKTILAISSVTAFPNHISLLTEEDLLKGRPDKRALGYSLSKRYLDELIHLYREDNYNYTSILPTNLYGIHDNFSENTSNLIPNLIYKIKNAIKNQTDLEIFGDGLSLRQFCNVDDLASILIGLLTRNQNLINFGCTNILPGRLIVSQPRLYSIRDVVELLVKITGFTREVKYGIQRFDELRVRQCSTYKLSSTFGLIPTTELEQGLRNTWEWYNNE